MVFKALTRKNRGFSLLEVILVMLLLITAFFPLLQVLSAGLVASGEAKGSNTAIKIAQEKMELIKNTTYAGVSSEANAAISGWPGFTRQVIVTTPSANLKNVMVVVYWYTPDGSRSSVEVSSLIYNF